MPTNYAYSDFSGPDALYLELGGVNYPVSQFNSSFAVNEIPTAICLLALGRRAGSRGAAEPSPLHANSQHRRMTPCRVMFSPTGSYAPNVDWPAGARPVFIGYFMGFAYRKMQGKVQAVAHLQHWLCDLACSSATTGGLHPSSPADFTAPAVMEALEIAGAAAPAAYLSADAVGRLIYTDSAKDVWGSIKKIFCTLANIKTAPMAASGKCVDSSNYAANDRALLALSRMEGPTGPEYCEFASEDGPEEDGPERYAVPLTMSDIPDAVQDCVTRAIGNESVTSYASTNFWDKLVGQLCPAFGMAVVPMVGRALVIADTPAYRGGVWRTISHHEQDSFDFSNMLEFPLRGIGVTATHEFDTGVGSTPRRFKILGACYAESGADGNDGVIKMVSAPPWLKINQSSYLAAPGTGRDETFGDALNRYYEQYAKTVYANEMLRGRNGTVSGKLRFDIAPGSIVRIRQAAERFIGGEDDLAAPLVACVSRVTTTINAEAPAAATTFQLSHMRWEFPENLENRTSVDAHPLFGKSIHGGGRHGAPLVTAYDLEIAPSVDRFAGDGPTLPGAPGDTPT